MRQSLPDASADVEPPRLAIIIPVRADHRIFELLEHLSRQAGIEHCEVVVACDGAPSSMLTRLAMAQQRVRLSLLRLHAAGPGGAINAGILSSRAERVLILDSDCAIGDGYVQAMLDVPGDVVAARGPVHFIGRTLLARLTARYRSAIYDIVVAEGRLYTPNLMARRELFLSLGMFRTEITHSYDSEFSDRAMHAGIRAVLVGGAAVWHDCHTQIAREVRVWWHYGQGRFHRRCAATCGMRRNLRSAVFGDVPWRTALLSLAQFGYVVAYVLVRTAGYAAAATRTRVLR